jgi:hypothetical protein
MAKGGEMSGEPLRAEALLWLGLEVSSSLGSSRRRWGPSGQKAGIKRSRAGGGHGELHEKPEMKISDMTLTLDGWEDETPIFSPYEKVGCTQSLIRGE